MELRIDFPALPPGMDFTEMKAGLDSVLEDDGWLLHSGIENGAGYVELELEDERMNPKYGIMAVKSFLQRTAFPKETTITLAGVAVGIYE